MADVAPAVRQLGRESARFFANPSNLGLISANGDRLGDLDTPAPIFLLPELGDDPEPDKRVMQVQGQALRCHCKLDSWIAAHRVNGAIAAHQPKLLQPGREWVRLTSARTRREIRDCMPADLEGREMVGYQFMEVAENLRIGVGETWSCPSKAPFGDEVSQQAHHAEGHRCVEAETGHPSGHADAGADRNVMKRMPALCGQERMMASNLDRTTRPSRDLEARLDAAVHPRVNFAWLYRSIPTEAEYRWHLPPNGVLDGRPFTGRRVVDQAV